MPFIPDPNALAEIARVSDSSNGVLPLPLSYNPFSFDSFGVASFFGGDNALSGMATVILIPGRRWLGWYNIPGSLEIAKQYARLAKLKISDTLFPNGDDDPAHLFKLDGGVGPKFIGTHSGVVLDHTGHPASLLTRKMKAMELSLGHTFDGVNGNPGTGQNVILVKLKSTTNTSLPNAQSKTTDNSLPDAQNKTTDNSLPNAQGKATKDLNSKAQRKDVTFPHLPMSQSAAWSLLPMSVSMGACILCGLVSDWFCFASIAVGMVAHGFACLVIGSGRLTFEHPDPAEGAPSGDGVLKGDRDIVILVGAGGEVNAITRGRFFLEYGLNRSDKPQDHAKGNQPRASCPLFSWLWHSSSSYIPLSKSTISRQSMLWAHIVNTWQSDILAPVLNVWQSLLPYSIWVSALLLMAQPIIQLFLIPLGTLFGQVMFITSILASWMYNIYLSYHVGRDDIQTKILFKTLGLEDANIQKYRLCTWTSTIAFTCFILASVEQLDDPLSFLNAVLPSDTEVWKTWKLKMVEVLKNTEFSSNSKPRKFLFPDAEIQKGQEKQGKDLLKILLDDAQDAWSAWTEIYESDYIVTLQKKKDGVTNNI